MTDQDPNDRAPELPPLRLPPPETDSGLRVLGSIPPGEYDSHLNAPQGRPEPQRSRRKTERPEAQRTPLPRGALVTLVRSGGLVFRTSAVTVYRDGRVTYDADGPGGERERAAWVLSDAELEELRREIASIDFDAHTFAYGRQSPDAYAYELVARVGRRVRRLEMSEGSIPADVEPLVRQLASYAPPR
ncbi:MAG: hypothetical protein DIU80_004260 [Chloroflexota bacterium]|nr:MAG: hypothetical protein DIU80_04960 [Chloroflexota bacterium]